MYMNGCLAYQNIKAEIKSIQDTINIAITTELNVHISITLSYLQAKVLAESLVNFTDQIELKCFINSKLTGDIKMIIPLVDTSMNEMMTKSIEQGDEGQCQQNISDVPTEAA